MAEGDQISDGDVSFDEVTLLPSTLKSLKVLGQVSNELIRQSVVGWMLFYSSDLSPTWAMP